MLEFGAGHGMRIVESKNRPPHIARIPKGGRSTDTPFRRYDVITSSAPIISYKNGPDTIRSLEPFTIRVQMPDGKYKFIHSKNEEEK